MRPFVPALIFAVGIALTWQVRLQQAAPLARPLNTVLPSVEGYAARDQVISEAEQRVAGMTNYVARVFMRDTVAAFSTLVSYYDRQTQGRTIHSPRNCLPGAGWEIVSGGTREVIVDGSPQTVNRYVLRNGGHTALAYYWYQGRGRVTANEYRVKWNLLRDAALKGRTEEALVRVIVPISSSATQAPDAEALADRVAPLLMSEVSRALPGPAPRRS
jgi:EpsI family protein